MGMTNADYVKMYKNKHKLEPVLFTKNVNGKKIKIDDIVNPLKLDFRQLVSPTDNQYDTPHCSAFSTCQILESMYWERTGKMLQLDADHVYAKAKEMDGMMNVEGTFPEYTMKAGLEMCGFLDPKAFDIGTFRNDKTDDTIESLKFLIHKHKFLQGGFIITDEWYKLKKGNSILEKANGRSLGGHAITICGYAPDGLIIQNSWGKTWGANGFGRIAWNVVLKQLMYVAFFEEKD